MNFRKIFRILHRDLSFLFSGMLIIYAVSGILLNHKNTINTKFDVDRKVYKLEKQLPAKNDFTEADVRAILSEIGEEGNYTKHYFPDDEVLKVFLKGGSNLVLNMGSGEAVYESVRPRVVIGAISRLHYNPGMAWTVFSDIFVVALLVIIITGLFMIKGRRGIWGVGGVELLIGVLIPIIFMLI